MKRTGNKRAKAPVTPGWFVKWEVGGHPVNKFFRREPSAKRYMAEWRATARRYIASGSDHDGSVAAALKSLRVEAA